MKVYIVIGVISTTDYGEFKTMLEMFTNYPAAVKYAHKKQRTDSKYEKYIIEPWIVKESADV